MAKDWLKKASWLGLLCGTLLGAASLEEIRIGDSQGDFGYPNPYQHYPRGPGYVRMSWVFDTLIWKDRSGFRGALAKEWRYDEKNRTFIFLLQPEAKWHDGHSVSAEDVAFTVDYFRRHPYFWVDVSAIERVEVKSPHEVHFHLLRPYSPFLSDIGGTMPILPKHIWAGVENPKTFLSKEAFIGSGPYRYVDFDKVKGSYLYEAFEGYYGGKPKAKRLLYVRSDKPLNALLAGQIHLAGIKPTMQEMIQKNPNLKIIEDEKGWTKKLMINHRRPLLNERSFRQALAYAIDREELIAKSQQGEAYLASLGLLSSDHAFFAPNLPAYAYNPQKAKEILASLGYHPNREGKMEKEGKPLKLQLLASTITAGGQAGSDRDGEMIQKMLERIGITVELLALESTTLDLRVKNWEFDLAVSGHGGISGDAKILNEMISPNEGAGSVNSARFEGNARLNELLRLQIEEMNPSKRQELVQEIQQLHALELPAIPLYYPKSLSAFDARLGVEWFYTPGGIAKGIPISQNKRALLP